MHLPQSAGLLLLPINSSLHSMVVVVVDRGAEDNVSIITLDAVINSQPADDDSTISSIVVSATTHCCLLLEDMHELPFRTEMLQYFRASEEEENGLRKVMKCTGKELHGKALFYSHPKPLRV